MVFHLLCTMYEWWQPEASSAGTGPNKSFQGLQKQHAEPCVTLKVSWNNAMGTHTYCPLFTMKAPFSSKQLFQRRKEKPNAITAIPRFPLLTNFGIKKDQGDISFWNNICLWQPSTFKVLQQTAATPANPTSIKAQLSWHLDSGEKK